MKIAVLKESDPLETRVSATPETVKKFIALGADLAVEAGAGDIAGIADSAYAEAGATVADRAAVIGDADAVFCVRGPDAGELSSAKPLPATRPCSTRQLNMAGPFR